MRSKILIITAFVGLLLFAFCTTDKVAGGSTETTNAAVSAMLRNPGGTPAVHATVHFYPVNYNPHTGGLGKILATVDSTVTNANGNYTANLDTGTYNILAAGDSGVVYQDSIKVTKDSAINPPTDTLKAPGSLRGVIRMQPGDDARKVFIIAMGTNTITEPQDSVGNFALANMAQGSYSVRILSVLDNYGVLDTSLAIKAGKNDTLADTIVLPFTGIPTPTGLKISYDTMKQIVTLTWDKADTSLVKGYWVYRQRADSNFVRISTMLMADTTFVDSMVVAGQSYQYELVAVDKGDNEGRRSLPVSVNTVSAFQLVDSLPAPICGAAGCFLSQLRKSGLGQYIGITDAGVALVMDTVFTKIRSWNTSNGALSLALDKEGHVYVADRIGAQILKFDSLGNQLQKWGGTGPGQLTSPTYIEVAPDGRIFVCDNHVSDNMSTLQVFDTGGTYLGTFGENGNADGQYGLVTGFAIDLQGYVYVADGNNHRIEKFDSAGVFVETWSGLTAQHLCCDHDFLLFTIIESDGSYPVQVYRNDGTRVAMQAGAGVLFGAINGLAYVLGGAPNSLMIYAYRYPTLP